MHWTVLGPGARPRYLRCRCICGAEKDVRRDHLRNGASTSCGCAYPPRNTQHGMNGTPTYRSWAAMKQRCSDDPTRHHYPYYAARGITVCERWRNSFENFLADMGERPEGMTLDRIDVNGHYQPGNCRWADMKTQRANRRDS